MFGNYSKPNCQQNSIKFPTFLDKKKVVDLITSVRSQPQRPILIKMYISSILSSQNGVWPQDAVCARYVGLDITINQHHSFSP